LLASNPGKPHPIKLQEQHKSCFNPNASIDEYAGEQLAKWAMGGSKLVEQPDPAPPANTTGTSAEALPPIPNAPEEPQSDPAEMYRVRLRTCERSVSAINGCWSNIPETLKQDCYPTYTDELKKVGKANK
jgi:hypothetical protein